MAEDDLENQKFPLSELGLLGAEITMKSGSNENAAPKRWSGK
jgi:hypothetical protein